MSETLSSTMPATAPAKVPVLQSLIQQEWKQCRTGVGTLSALWFIGLWVLVIFHHPAWLMVLGLLYVLTITSAQAGRDVMDGTEEFSFTLSPGRGPLFVSRMVPGFAFLTINGLVGGAAIALDLPQRVWSLVFSSGLTEPFHKGDDAPLWYAMALLAPLAAHAITFAVAALAGTRAGVNLAWLAGFGGGGVIVLAGCFAESLLWDSPNGFLTSPALFAAAVLVPFAGYQAYLRKEASGAKASAGSKVGFVILAILIAAMVLVFVAAFTFKRTAVREVELQKVRSIAEGQKAELHHIEKSR